MLKRSLLYLLGALAFINISCEDEDKDPAAIDNIDNGAVLTTVAVEGVNFNVFDPSSSDLSVNLLFNDFANNDSMESVDLFVQFIDTTPVNGQVLSLDEVQIGTLTLADFNEIIDGFPANTFILNGQDALDLLGLTSSDLDGGDLFILRYALNLNDGRTFSSDNVGINVAATSHLAPFRYSTEVFCPIDDATYLTGTYLLEQIAGNDPFFPNYGESFGTQTVEIINPDGGTNRTFNFAYFPTAFASDYRMDLSLVCGRINLSTDTNGGNLGCGGGTIQASEDPDNIIFFDLSDDTVIDLTFLDFTNDAGCGTGSTPMTVRLTKQ